MLHVVFGFVAVGLVLTAMGLLTYWAIKMAFLDGEDPNEIFREELHRYHLRHGQLIDPRCHICRTDPTRHL